MIRNDSIINFNSGESISVLPVGVYVPDKDNFGNIFLKKIEDFNSIDLGGRSNSIKDFLTSHYRLTKGNFGCIFEGISGMGKTATIRNICNELNLPVIFIQDDFSGKELNEIVSNINSDCVLFFDEFEKIYTDTNVSNSLLSFFDGINTKNRVVNLVSFNQRSKLSNYFFGRPGRFLFNFRFFHLSTEDAMAFIKSRLEVRAEYEDKMYTYLDKIDNLSYDICDKIITLIGLHGIQTFIEFSRDFNVDECDYVIEAVLSMEQKKEYKKIRYINEEDGEYLYVFGNELFYLNELYRNGFIPVDLHKMKVGDSVAIGKKELVALNEEFETLDDSVTIEFTRAKSIVAGNFMGWD
jgi:hypothetical protein